MTNASFWASLGTAYTSPDFDYATPVDSGPDTSSGNPGVNDNYLDSFDTAIAGGFGDWMDPSYPEPILTF